MLLSIEPMGVQKKRIGSLSILFYFLLDSTVVETIITTIILIRPNMCERSVLYRKRIIKVEIKEFQTILRYSFPVMTSVDDSIPQTRRYFKLI